MNIKVLGSSTDGNSTIISDKDTIIILDCGVPNMYKMDINWDSVKGIFITHGHSDHISRLPSVIKKCSCPIFISQLEWESNRVRKIMSTLKNIPLVSFISSGSPISVGVLTVYPIYAQHDTPMPYHFFITDSNGSSFFYGCDTCDITYKTYRLMLLSKLIMIDSNYASRCMFDDIHDKEPIENPYSDELKRRIVREGHMCNDDIVQLRNQLVSDGFTGKILPAHTSFKYNSKNELIKSYSQYPDVIIRYRDEYPYEVSI